MKKSFVVPFMIVLVVALAFTGCAKTAPAPTPAPTPSPAPAPAPTTPIKIGLLFPTTGFIAFAGQMGLEGAKYAFEEAGYQVAGRKIEVIIEDSGGIPEMALDKARKMVEHDKVAMINGTMTAGEQMAVGSYMTKMGVPLLVSVNGEWGLPEWCFVTSGSKPQQSSPMGRYAYDELGLRKVSVMTSDWASGHVFLNAFAKVFKEKGGQVTQEQYPPMPTQDFASYLANLKDADAVMAWFTGTDALQFLNQYYDFGVHKRMPLVAAFHGNFIAPYLLEKLRPEAAEAMIGVFSPTDYTPLLETDINKRFVQAFREKYGHAPQEDQQGPYVGSLIALKALEATGGDTTPDKLRQAILGLKFEVPGGMVRFDPKTRSNIEDIYIIRVEKRDGEYVWVPVHTYKDVPPEGY